MTEQEALSKMIPPAGERPNKPYRGGVIQVCVTSSCDKSCCNCTQASNVRRKPWFMSPQQFEQALLSLKGYWGVVGMFGGNPCIHPQFSQLCQLMKEHVPAEQRGIWSNNPISLAKAAIMRETFNPRYSNLNVHLDRTAYDLFKTGWPECNPVGLNEDSRHSPPWVAMKDVIPDEGQRWELISDCDINQQWSAMIGIFRGELRAWFCEIAGAQAMLYQDDMLYPDTGLRIGQDGQVQGMYDKYMWWELGMLWFTEQVRKHCHECGVPLRGHGSLAIKGSTTQVSQTHWEQMQLKGADKSTQIVTTVEELGTKLRSVVQYLQNSKVA